MAAARQLVLHLGYTLEHFVGNAAEIPTVHRGIDVDHGLHVVVGNLGWSRGVRGTHEISENLRRDAGRGSGHWRVLQRLVIIHAILRRLHGDVVAYAVLRIEPEGRRGLKAVAQRNENVARDILGLQANGLRACAIDIHVKRGFVESLLHVDVNGSGDMAELVRQFFRHNVVAALVRSRYRDVDRRGRSEIQDLRHDVGRLKEELRTRKSLRQLLAELVDVSAGRLPAFFLQLHEDFGVGSAERSGIAIAQIDAAVRDADIVQNRLQFLRRNGFADDGVDLIGEARRFLDTKAGASTEVQTNLPGIDFGKEIPAEHEDEPDGQQAKQQEAGAKQFRPLQGRIQPVTVALAKSFKAMLEFLLEAAEETLFFADVFFGLVFVLAAQEVHGHRWDDRSGPSIRSQHGEADGLRQWHEKIFRHARKEKHGKKDDTDAKRGNEGRHGDLLSAVENRLHRFFAHGQVTVDVLDFHGGVIDEDADGQREPAERHDVDGLAESAEDQDADENRKRNRNGDDQRALPVS